MGFEDKAFDNSSSNTTDDLQGETHNRFLPPNVVYLFNVQDNPRPQNDIDILEQNIREKSPYLLKLLLKTKQQDVIFAGRAMVTLNMAVYTLLKKKYYQN